MAGILEVIGSARDIERRGKWFIDSKGRYALFRGVNIAPRSKHAPYLPVFPLNVKDLGYNAVERCKNELASLAKYFDGLQNMGVNVVRLLVIWKAIEPEPQPDPSDLSDAGKTYLQCIKQVIDFLYERGIFVIIDFHQDLAHEDYGGDGFPDWALGLSGAERELAKAKLWWEKRLFKNRKWWMWKYLGDRNVIKTFEDFWKRKNRYNGRTSQEHLVKTIGATVYFLNSGSTGQGHDAILGYEPFNEPVPIGNDDQEFEVKILGRYYGEVINEIRNGQAGDKQPFIFMEPRTSWKAVIEYESQHGFVDDLIDWRWYLDLTSINDSRVVFAFHYYDPMLFVPLLYHWDRRIEQRGEKYRDIFKVMYDDATGPGKIIPFLTEFGVSNDLKKEGLDMPGYSDATQAFIDMQCKEIEDKLLDCACWSYDFYNTKSGGDNWNSEDFSILGPGRELRNADVVARPYPMRSSAEPVGLQFDLQTKQSFMKFEGLPVEEPTVIFVPYSIHYRGTGFDVLATGGEIEWKQDIQMLFWKPDRNSTKHQLVIHPRGLFNEMVFPDYAELKSETKKVLSVKGDGQAIPQPNGGHLPVTLVGKVVDGKGAPLRDLFVEAFQVTGTADVLFDDSEGFCQRLLHFISRLIRSDKVDVLLGRAVTDSDGRFTITYVRQPGRSVDYLTVCDSYNEVYKQEITGPVPQELTIVVRERAEVDDPYRGSRTRVFSRFVGPKLFETLDSGKIYLPLAAQRGRGFLEDWLFFTPEDAGKSYGHPGPLVPKNPKEEEHNHDVPWWK